MTDDPNIYRLFVTAGRQSQAITSVLPVGEVARLFVVRLPGSNPVQAAQADAAPGDDLILASAEELAEDVRQEDYAQNAEVSSQYVIVQRRRYENLLEEHDSLKSARQNLRTVSEMLRDGILVIGKDGVVRYANAATCELFQRDAGQLVGYLFGYPIADGCDSEIDLVRPDGQERIVKMRATSSIWDGEPVYLASLHDVTDQKRLQYELEDLATHDGLTGLFNHRSFYSLLEDELQRAKRYNHPLSLLMLDIDHFKKVNDIYGHCAGDAILGGLSQLLEDQARENDRVCRYGGEEIMVILPETAVDDAAKVARRLCTTVAEQQFDIGEGERGSITVSIGVSGYPCHAESASELVGAADVALYAAKENGRNAAFRYAFEPCRIPECGGGKKEDERMAGEDAGS